MKKVIEDCKDDCDKCEFVSSCPDAYQFETIEDK